MFTATPQPREVCMSFIHLPPLGVLERRVRSPSKPTTQRQPGPEFWREHFFSFGDCCIRVLESASKETTAEARSTVFFLHGRFSHASSWFEVALHLAPNIRCVSIDFPGFGKSF